MSNELQELGLNYVSKKAELMSYLRAAESVLENIRSYVKSLNLSYEELTQSSLGHDFNLFGFISYKPVIKRIDSTNIIFDNPDGYHSNEAKIPLTLLSKNGIDKVVNDYRESAKDD